MASATSKTYLVATGVIETNDQMAVIPQPKNVSVTQTIPALWDNRYGTAQKKYFQTHVMWTDGTAVTQNDTSEYVLKSSEVADQPRL
jgi:hypothetical protein